MSVIVITKNVDIKIRSNSCGHVDWFIPIAGKCLIGISFYLNVCLKCIFKWTIFSGVGDRLAQKKSVYVEL